MKKLLLFVFAFTLLAGVANATLPYTYDGSSDTPGSGGVAAFDALDGTWSHDNGSDAWDGSMIGAGRPGGVMTLTQGSDTFLRIQDTGDPRDYGMGDPGSNRKLYLGHQLAGASDTFLDDGISLSFRARIATTPPLDDVYPDGGIGIAPWPAGGDGYAIHDGGKGSISLHQNTGGTISFSLVLEADPQTPGVFLTDGLTTNNLNGTAVSSDVDSGEAGTQNVISLNPLVWHDFMIAIMKDPSGAGTHQLDISIDGGPIQSLLVTAGSGNDFSGMNYLAIGHGSTGLSGAIDIDYVSVVPEPLSLTLLGLGGVALIRRRR